MIPVENSKSSVLVCVIIFFLSGCSLSPTIPSRFWAGQLESDQVNKEHFPKIGGHKYAQLWEYLGEEGTRVVIADIAEPGTPPPELYLFRPNTDDCVAQAVLLDDAGYLVIDHTLEESGEYALLVRAKDQDKKVDYTLYLVKLNAHGTYEIDPDNPYGKIIQSNDILLEIWDEHDELRFVAIIATPLLILPKIVGAGLLFVGEGISFSIDLLNIRGRFLYKNIAEYDQAQ